MSIVLSPRPAARRTAGPRTQRSEKAPAPPEPLSILVVDDVEDTREMYRRYLDFHGLRVATAPDGLAALQAVSLEAPDVVVLDLAMPVLSGWEAIRTLKRRPRTRAIPIIAMSGHEARESALAAGADSFLDKPCLPHQLLAEILRFRRRPDNSARQQ